MSHAIAVLDQRLTPRKQLLLATIVGTVLGLGAQAAIATNWSTHHLWYHGVGTNNGDGYIHPLNSSSDGAGRTSCISWLVSSGHGAVDCALEPHNHVSNNDDPSCTICGDVYVGGEEPSASGHHESSQTSMAHHHHSNDH